MTNFNYSDTIFHCIRFQFILCSFHWLVFVIESFCSSRFEKKLVHYCMLCIRMEAVATMIRSNSLFLILSTRSGKMDHPHRRRKRDPDESELIQSEQKNGSEEKWFPFIFRTFVILCAFWDVCQFAIKMGR